MACGACAANIEHHDVALQSFDQNLPVPDENVRHVTRCAQLGCQSYTRTWDKDIAAAATISAREDTRIILLLELFLPNKRHNFTRPFKPSPEVAVASSEVAVPGDGEDISLESSSVK